MANEKSEAKGGEDDRDKAAEGAVNGAEAAGYLAETVNLISHVVYSCLSSRENPGKGGAGLFTYSLRPGYTAFNQEVQATCV